MRLEQLHYLLVTANYHSMHKASEILHVSQQNISKAIRDLEKELTVPVLMSEIPDQSVIQGLGVIMSNEKLRSLAFSVKEAIFS